MRSTRSPSAALRERSRIDVDAAGASQEDESRLRRTAAAPAAASPDAGGPPIGCSVDEPPGRRRRPLRVPVDRRSAIRRRDARLLPAGTAASRRCGPRAPARMPPAPVTREAAEDGGVRLHGRRAHGRVGADSSDLAEGGGRSTVASRKLSSRRSKPCRPVRYCGRDRGVIVDCPTAGRRRPRRDTDRAAPSRATSRTARLLPADGGLRAQPPGRGPLDQRQRRLSGRGTAAGSGAARSGLRPGIHQVPPAPAAVPDSCFRRPERGYGWTRRGAHKRIRAVIRPRTALLALAPVLLHALAREADRGLGLVLRAEVEPDGLARRGRPRDGRRGPGAAVRVGPCGSSPGSRRGSPWPGGGAPRRRRRGSRRSRARPRSSRRSCCARR